MIIAKSFVSKLVSKGSVPIYFVTCKDAGGKQAYAYLISTPEKMRMYENIRAGEFDLNDYGKIIVSGFGKTPSAEVKKMLQEKYGLEAI